MARLKRKEFLRNDFDESMRPFVTKISRHITLEKHLAHEKRGQISYFRTILNTGRLSREEQRNVRKVERVLGRIESVNPVATGGQVYNIAGEIMKDFAGKKNLRVFGFGVGYGQLLFFLKKHMGAHVEGVDLGYFSEDITKSHNLGVIHGKNATSTLLKKRGKFNVTYSIDLLDSLIIDRKTALKTLDNIAHMTAKGGKTYHTISSMPNKKPIISEKDFLDRGFKIDFWQKSGNEVFAKLTKVRDN